MTTFNFISFFFQAIGATSVHESIQSICKHDQSGTNVIKLFSLAEQAGAFVTYFLPKPTFERGVNGGLLLLHSNVTVLCQSFSMSNSLAYYAAVMTKKKRFALMLEQNKLECFLCRQVFTGYSDTCEQDLTHKYETFELLMDKHSSLFFHMLGN